MKQRSVTPTPVSDTLGWLSHRKLRYIKKIKVLIHGIDCVYNPPSPGIPVFCMQILNGSFSTPYIEIVPNTIGTSLVGIVRIGVRLSLVQP